MGFRNKFFHQDKISCTLDPRGSRVNLVRFYLGISNLSFTHVYKYLGFWLNEFLGTISRILDSANSALSSFIAKKTSQMEDFLVPFSPEFLMQQLLQLL